MQKKPRKSPKHAFRFKILQGTGKVKEITAWARVKQAKRDVHLVLAADDVRESISLKGVGNTQTCSMACCAKRQAGKFPHPVEGYIDWQYAMAYVVTKVNANGLPSECIAYMHRDKIARLNDTKGGQQQLLAQLERDGNREIHLVPPVYRPREPGRVRGANTGERKSKTRAIGAKHRFSIAQAGGAF